MIVPENVHPALRKYWKHWNIGQSMYFRMGGRERETCRYEPFRITKEEEALERLKTDLDPGRNGRFVPEGNYVKLYTKNADGWHMMMSDTPDELNDHLHILQNVRGRVLVNGLGLGCILNCLIHHEDVFRIDVVEIDQDVIDLVGPFYIRQAEKTPATKINIYHGDASTFKWPRGRRWNYIWHDIWPTINPDNLRIKDEDEGFGISYERMHRRFANRYDDFQKSWAFERSKWMQEVMKTEDRVVRTWIRKFKRATFDDRKQMILEPASGLIRPNQYEVFLKRNMPEQHKYIIELCESGEIEHISAKVLLGDSLRHYAMQQTPFVGL